MTQHQRGLFVTMDGMGGAGKTATTRRLRERLIRRGYRVHLTSQPSRNPIGELARHGTNTYYGYALACLVAADRYHQLDTEIRPQLAAGAIVICDRYVASSYVLQRMDQVPIGYIEALNAAADIPDLAVILTAAPEVTARRIGRRGAHSRFENGLATSQTEAGLYADTAQRLTERGYPLLTIKTTHTPLNAVVDHLANRVAALAGPPTHTPGPRVASRHG